MLETNYKVALESTKSYLEERCSRYNKYRDLMLNGEATGQDRVKYGELLGMTIALGAIEEALDGYCPID